MQHIRTRADTRCCVFTGTTAAHDPLRGAIEMIVAQNHPAARKYR
jgi:hypothetical protein